MVKFCNFHTVQYVPKRCVVSGRGSQFTKSDQGSDLNLIIFRLVKLFQNVGTIPDNHICILFLGGSWKKKLREISNRNIFRVNVFARSKRFYVKSILPTTDIFRESESFTLICNEIQLVDCAHCGNYRNYLSHFSVKNFVKTTVLLKS